MFNWYSFRVKYICSDALPKKKRHTQGPCACVTPDERVCRGHVCRNWSSSVWRVKHRAKPHALNCNCGLYSFACFEVFSRQHSYLCSLGRNAHEASDHFFFSFWKERFVFFPRENAGTYDNVYIKVSETRTFYCDPHDCFLSRGCFFFFLLVYVHVRNIMRSHCTGITFWFGMVSPQNTMWFRSPLSGMCEIRRRSTLGLQNEHVEANWK